MSMGTETSAFATGILMALFVASIVEGCTEPNPGSEWGECYPNNTCNALMVCHREKCVAPMPAPDAGPGPR